VKDPFGAVILLIRKLFSIAVNKKNSLDVDSDENSLVNDISLKENSTFSENEKIVNVCRILFSIYDLDYNSFCLFFSSHSMSLSSYSSSSSHINEEKDILIETTNFFLIQLANKFGKFLKGGIANVNEVCKIVLRDFNNGKIPFYTLPPPSVVLSRYSNHNNFSKINNNNNTGTEIEEDNKNKENENYAVVVNELKPEFRIEEEEEDVDDINNFLFDENEEDDNTIMFDDDDDDGNVM
jgi:hypothetical protein